MKHQQKLVFQQEGHYLPNSERGDVIVMLKEEMHPVFKRTDADLFIDKKISITESLCGFQMIIKHLDSRDLLIVQKPGTITKNNDLKCIPHEGMPIHKNPYEKGSLYVKFTVDFPDSIDTDKISMIESCLPPRPIFVMPEGEHVEEVSLQDYATAKEKNAYNSSDDEEEAEHGAGIQCQTS